LTAALGFINASEESGNIIVQFGKNENQVFHAFRHTDALGLKRSVVQSAIKTDIKSSASQIVAGKPYNKVITVEGRQIQYTAYKLLNGVINIGRIHGVN
jgi:hypothetical protein